MSGPQLSHAFIFAKDLDRLVAFYERAFGWIVTSSAPGFVVLHPPGGRGAGVAVHQLPDAIAASIVLTAPPVWRDETAYKLTFATEDLDRLRSAVLDEGGRAKDPWTWNGSTYCECTDPEGNVIQLMNAPSADAR